MHVPVLGRFLVVLCKLLQRARPGQVRLGLSLGVFDQHDRSLQSLLLKDCFGAKPSC
jgi:hypothetical protein